MKMAWFQWVRPATAATALLLAGASFGLAQEDNGVRPVAEELGQRTKPAAAAGEQKKGLSDSAVRVLMTYAFSIIPDEKPGPDGKKVKIDKSDPNVFLIPDEDARRVIRAATRSAYAEACELPELALANYQTLIKGEEAKKIWSEQQMMMITALHAFSTSYFSGNVKIGEPAEGASDGSTGAAKDGSAEQGSDFAVPSRPQCPPEQKQKVENAINAYVQSAQAPAQ
jgi:hypothetical protein